MVTPSVPAPVVVWFRHDLRLADHAALTAAVASGRPVVCLYVLETSSDGPRPMGGASRWWLAGSLRALDAALRRVGSRLVLRRGAAVDILPALGAEIGAETVYMTRRYDGPGQTIDVALKQRLADHGVALKQYAGPLLFEPEQVRTQSGAPFSVFTPFWRAARSRGELAAPLPVPARILDFGPVASDALDDWALEPRKPDWAGGLRATWQRGEAGARERLATFLNEELAGYAAVRDRPDRDQTSRLSPHLRFGEISPRQVWHAAQMARETAESRRPNDADIEKLLSELGWREFSYHLLARHPDLATRNLQSQFDAMRWRTDPAALAAWQRGQTGYPLVDAGMRQLWQTGWMHNRVRMVVASFLVKHLLIDWRLGEAWFWDTLVDADPASNPASWQWVAGCGADAAPFFRVFNPILQGEKFDPEGTYVRKFVPELRSVASDFVQRPWDAPTDLLTAAEPTDGYPAPMVDHRAARARALKALADLKP